MNTFSWYPKGSVSLSPSPVTLWHQSWAWRINPSKWEILFATITAVIVHKTPLDWIQAAIFSDILDFVCPCVGALHLLKLESEFNHSTSQYSEWWGSSGPRAPSFFHVRTRSLAFFSKYFWHSMVQKMSVWWRMYDLLLLLIRRW